MINASFHISNPPQGVAQKFSANIPARPVKDDRIRLRVKVQDRECGFNFRVGSTWFESQGGQFYLIVTLTHESFFNPAVEPSAIV